MTYKEIVDEFYDICRRHEIIREFGYGAISDMKTMNTETVQSYNGPDNPYIESLTNYPYVYLVPGQSTRTSQAISYRFQMIVMDTVLDNGLEIKPTDDFDQKDPPYDQVLQAQSDCQQYIDDIIADLRFHRSTNDKLKYPLMDAQLSVNLTPFKERFQDTVAGMTATIEIQIAQPINLCIAPIEDDNPKLIDSYTVYVRDNVPYNYGNLLDDTWPIPKARNRYRVNWNFDISQNEAISLDNAPNNEPVFTIEGEADSGTDPVFYIAEQKWISQVGETIEIKGSAEFETIDVDPDDRVVRFGFGYANEYPNGDDATEQPTAINILSGNVLIYELGL